MLDDNELAVEGEDDIVEEEDEGVELEEESSAPAPAPSTFEQMVPVDRLNEVARERDEARNLVSQLAARMQPQSTATPARTSYVRPDADEQTRKWQGFVGETVDGVVEAKLAAHRAAVNQQILQAAEMLDDQRARAKFADYDAYAADINTLRQQWYESTGNAAPREYAYYVVKGMRATASKGTVARAKVVKRMAPAAGGASAGPARVKRKITVGELTPERIAKMSEKEAFDILSKENVRVL